MQTQLLYLFRSEKKSLIHRNLNDFHGYLNVRNLDINDTTTLAFVRRHRRCTENNFSCDASTNFPSALLRRVVQRINGTITKARMLQQPDAAAPSYLGRA